MLVGFPDPLGDPEGLLGLLPEGGQFPILRPKIVTHGIPGTLSCIAGGTGNSPPGGGPGMTPHKAMGATAPGGSMMGITVGPDEPGDVVVIH